MAARKYSDETLNQAAEMREAGNSCQAIANKLGMSVGAVSWHCLRLGADSPKTKHNTARPTGPMLVRRSGHIVRRFTEKEDQVLIEMDLAGERVCEMARRLNRPPNSVRGRLMTIARREERLEVANGVVA